MIHLLIPLLFITFHSLKASNIETKEVINQTQANQTLTTTQTLISTFLNKTSEQIKSELQKELQPTLTTLSSEAKQKVLNQLETFLTEIQNDPQLQKEFTQLLQKKLTPEEIRTLNIILKNPNNQNLLNRYDELQAAALTSMQNRAQIKQKNLENQLLEILRSELYKTP